MLTLSYVWMVIVMAVPWVYLFIIFVTNVVPKEKGIDNFWFTLAIIAVFIEVIFITIFAAMKIKYKDL